MRHSDFNTSMTKSMQDANDSKGKFRKSVRF